MERGQAKLDRCVRILAGSAVSLDLTRERLSRHTEENLRRWSNGECRPTEKTVQYVAEELWIRSHQVEKKKKEEKKENEAQQPTFPAMLEKLLPELPDGAEGAQLWQS